MHFIFQKDDTIGPADIANLREVFEALCEREHLSRHSAVADEVAKRILQLYKAGVRDRTIFMAVIQSRAKRLH
ncbi:putative nucleic acid-binding protein [Rhizobium azooxidifex]|uniref:Putative nucleic acid-binding protein n=1 Tax=Mycoplana azooxidifex TaxID=1636188 RepID=A0A7W6DAH0_9HYPH|nr:hypothetical protein [Mycoplana azooxidifex]MBB3979641.1 putative nucleic acid-binding protein [Mycoplana azooxidifex]